MEKSLLEHVTGLRGVAIALVVLFHLMPTWCRCGHFGVDVFFVLSGYFMFTAVRRDGFALGEYYGKKVVRILPPLLAVVLVLYPCALYLYTVTYRQGYAEAGVAALLGLSNEYLEYFTKGYFDFGSRENPLQHTWYLSVTLQMYVLVPPVALLCRRLSRWLGCSIWCVLFAVSFLAYHHAPAYPEHCPGVVSSLLAPLYAVTAWLPGEVFHSHASPYYWSVGRLWELMAGAGIGLLPAVDDRRVRYLLGLAGGLLVLGPVWVLAPGSLFNLPAVVGTLLLFRYGESGPVTRVLTNRVVVWLGTISFSLYLWHWPVHALYHYCTEQPESAGSLAVTGSISLLAALLAWRYVETRRFRHATVAGAWVGVLLLCGPMAVSGGAGWRVPGVPGQVSVTGYHSTGIYREGPLLEDLPTGFLPRHNWYGGGLYKNSIWDNHDESLLLKMGAEGVQPSFVMAGDSHANALYPVVGEVAAGMGCAGVFLRSYMTPLPGRDWHREQGTEMNVTPAKVEAFACWLERHPEIRLVVLGQWWEMRLRVYERDYAGQPNARYMACKDFQAALAAFCRRMQRAGKQVAVISQVPVIPVPNYDICHYVNKCLLRGKQPDPARICVGEDTYIRYAGEVNGRLQELEKQGLCTMLHQETGLFAGGEVRAYENGTLLMRDCSHLTYAGAQRALRGMLPQLQALLRSRAEK